MQQTIALETSSSIEAASDAALLQDFARTANEEPFNELARRHAGFVYASALRQVQDQATAQDITQAVFIALMRKASSLKGETVLTGWLFRSVRYLALDLHRRAARRTAREHEVASMLAHSEETEGLWERFSPHLDAALAALGTTERQAVLLRFFERKSWAEVGAMLGSNENAARVRVNRAISKMRAFFEKRGVGVSIEMVTKTLTENAWSPEPLRIPNAETLGSPRESVEELATRLLRRPPFKPSIAWTLAISIITLVILLRGEWLNKRNIAELRSAGRALVTQIDRTFTANDVAGFLATLIFRGPQDEPFRAALQEYLPAAAQFRAAMTAKFNSRDAWGATFKPLFSRALKGRPEHFSADFILLQATPDYIFLERPVSGEWKWDFFAQIPDGDCDQWLRKLASQARRFREAAERLRNDPAADEQAILSAVTSPE